MRNHKLLILGRSGSGKTTSLRNLDPKKTGIINADKQTPEMDMTGYNTVMTEAGHPDLARSNYVETSKPGSVVATLKAWETRDDIEVIILDTITHLITAYYITDALGKEFGGYKELGTSFWNIVDTIRDLKKSVVVFGHINSSFNDMGDKVVEMKSHGKMIKEFEPESYFNNLFMAEVIKQDGVLRWGFRTIPKEPVEKVKSPIKWNDDGTITRALDDFEDNDIQAIFAKLNQFYNV